MNKCEDCSYWFGKKDDLDGECRRNPPRPFLTPGVNPLTKKADLKIECFFPRTRPDIVCGEFKPKIILQ